MNLQFNMFNVLILFGALQGLILCFYLLFIQKNSQNSLYPFILFLFSLAFINLYYALLDIEFFAIFRPLHLFPYPAKWIIGPALLFYVTCRFDSERNLFQPNLHHLLFLPAFLVNFPFVYWFGIAWQESSYRIVRTISDTHFFRYNEIASVLFNLIILAYMLGWVVYQQSSLSNSKKEQRKFTWLKIFIWANFGVFFINLLLVATDLVYHDGQETRSWYYSLWILHTLFIYAIGFVGFSRSDILLGLLKKRVVVNEPSVFLQNLSSLIIEQKLFQNPDLRLGEIANLLQISSKELSLKIKSETDMNFSTFINWFRVEDVKKKLISPEFEKFTLIHLAKESGFNSKSSFNEIFKAQEGMSPSAYRKKQLNT